MHVLAEVGIPSAMRHEELKVDLTCEGLFELIYLRQREQIDTVQLQDEGFLLLGHRRAHSALDDCARRSISRIWSADLYNYT